MDVNSVLKKEITLGFTDAEKEDLRDAYCLIQTMQLAIGDAPITNLDTGEIIEPDDIRVVKWVLHSLYSATKGFEVT